ncbi:hypothetical protein Patl1_15559 [Pistacia atlantica]|uniref:Uncharacterized protein n=1 Tax=Pistacia atlantica TaxID=434234 RepID=A0ACC1BAP1_9ROSI|nr:hypothetical protein Patl1_15559 [Pistacia atlantica]
MFLLDRLRLQHAPRQLVALNTLRQSKGCFDVVLSDVHVPDMDGYTLLEHIGLEMDLPVIMMSADGRYSSVLRGIRHGACDYLIKPIRGSFDKNDRQKRASDEVEYASSADEGTEGSSEEEDDGELASKL